jgi:transposase
MSRSPSPEEARRAAQEAGGQAECVPELRVVPVSQIKIKATEWLWHHRIPLGAWTTPGLLEAPQPGEDGAMSNPRYTAEMRERAVKMVMQVRRESGQEKGAVARVAQQLGIGREALRGWVAQAEVDSGARPGTTSDDKQRIKELERENSELRRANEILKAASAYFARELGPSLPR